MKQGIDAYRRMATGDRVKRDELIRQHAPLVKRVAYRLIHRLPASVEVEDLISVGSIGLLHAIENFDASRGHRFEAYAEFRIKGAMLDELRSYDFMSRTARGRTNRIERARNRIESQTGRSPSTEELAEETGLAVEEIESTLAQGGSVAFLTMEDLGTIAEDQTEVPWELLSNAQPDDPFGHTFFRELREQLAEAIDSLPERLKMVLSLYYYNELNFKEIGRVLDLTESRISQLHSEAVAQIRRRLRKAV